MKNYQTQGIILRKKNFFETDKMLWVFTRDKGSIRIIAKGARKPLSKFSGHLELFYSCQLEVTEGKNIDILTGISIINSHSALSDNQKVLNTVYYIAELVCKTLPEEQINILVYELLVETLSLLDANNFQKMRYFFEFKLYCLLGLAPRLDKCVICSSDIAEEELNFNYEKGGIVCLSCARKMHDNIYLSKDDWKILVLIKTKDIHFLKRIKIGDKKLLTLKKCLEKMRYQIIENKLNCEKFV